MMLEEYKIPIYKKKQFCGLFAIVDANLYSFFNKFKWNISLDGYAYNSKLGFMHVFLMGERPFKQVTDHINGNKLDNRKCNLRFCSSTVNNLNSFQKQQNCSSQYIGISWNKKLKKWKSRIRINAHDYLIGHFNNEYEAHIAYEKAKKDYIDNGILPPLLKKGRPKKDL